MIKKKGSKRARGSSFGVYSNTLLALIYCPSILFHGEKVSGKAAIHCLGIDYTRRR